MFIKKLSRRNINNVLSWLGVIVIQGTGLGLSFFLFEKICPHNVNRAQMKERIEAELPEFHVQICEECCAGPLGRQCAWALWGLHFHQRRDGLKSRPSAGFTRTSSLGRSVKSYLHICKLLQKCVRICDDWCRKNRRTVLYRNHILCIEILCQCIDCFISNVLQLDYMDWWCLFYYYYFLISHLYI